MVKQQAYVKEYNAPYTYYNPINDNRQMYCVNIEMGADFRLAKNNRSRFDVFCGAGVRYQSNNVNYAFFNSSFWEHGSTNHATGSKILPNALLGVALKLYRFRERDWSLNGDL